VLQKMKFSVTRFNSLHMIKSQALSSLNAKRWQRRANFLSRFFYYPRSGT
jgi:hypothetical protein